MLKKPALAIDSSSVPGERSVRSDHPVTGHDNANWIRTVGKANSTNCGGASNSLRKPGIGGGLAAWNFSQRTPHFPLKQRAGCLHRHAINRLKFSSKITPDSIGQTIEVARRHEPEISSSVVSTQEPVETLFVAYPLRGTQIPILIGHNQHFPDGRMDPIHQ